MGKGEGEEGWLEGGRILGMVMWRGAREAPAAFPSSLLNPVLLLYFMLILTPQQLIADRWLMTADTELLSTVLLTADSLLLISVTDTFPLSS